MAARAAVVASVVPVAFRRFQQIPQSFDLTPTAEESAAPGARSIRMDLLVPMVPQPPNTQAIRAAQQDSVKTACLAERGLIMRQIRPAAQAARTLEQVAL